jgi:malonyl-CoA O-methyltransferase
LSINKGRVGSAFHRQAGEYDSYTPVQKRVADRLLNLTRDHVVVAPSEVLDLGCGTGRLLASLHRQYPQAHLYGLDLAYNMTLHARERLGGDVQLVNGDAEYLPFRHDAFDLVVSSSTLQWLDNLDLFFTQCRLILKDGGLLCSAFFGGKTLRELRECYCEAASNLNDNRSDRFEGRLHRFKEIADVQNVMERTGFDSVLLTSEIETDYYPDLSGLLRSIKRIGAGSSAQGKSAGGLGWRGVLNETSRLYRQRYGTDGMIPVTYEVFYIVAQVQRFELNQS